MTEDTCPVCHGTSRYLNGGVWYCSICHPITKIQPTIQQFCQMSCKHYLKEGCVYFELITGKLTFPLNCKGYENYTKILEKTNKNEFAIDSTGRAKNSQPVMATCHGNIQQAETEPVMVKNSNKEQTCHVRSSMTGSGKDTPLKLSSGQDEIFDEIDYQIYERIKQEKSHSEIAKLVKRNRNAIAQRMEKFYTGGYAVRPQRSHPGAKRYYKLTGKTLPELSNVSASRPVTTQKPRLCYTEERPLDSGISDPKTTGLSPEEIILNGVFDGKHHCTLRSEIVKNTYTKDGEKVPNWNNYERYQHEADGRKCISVNLSNDPHIIINPYLKTEGTVKQQRILYQKYAKAILSEFVSHYPGMEVTEPVLYAESTHNEMNDFIGKPLGKKFPPGEYRSPNFRRDSSDKHTPNKVEAIGEQLAENCEWVAVKLPEFAEKVCNILEAQTKTTDGGFKTVHDEFKEIHAEIAGLRTERKRSHKRKQKQQPIEYDRNYG